MGTSLATRPRTAERAPEPPAPEESPDVAPDGNGAAIDRLTNAPQLDDTFEFEVGEDGGRCVEMPSWGEQDAIDALARDVRAMVAPWAERRHTADFSFDTSALDVRIDQTFATQMRSILAVETGDSAAPPAWHQVPRVREAVAAALSAGTTRDALFEIAQFNPGLTTYANLLRFGGRLRHTYTFRVLRGGTVGAGRAIEAELRYENERGMSWTVTGTIALAQNPGDVELESTGDRLVADPIAMYFSPEDFASASVQTLSASIGPGVDVALPAGGGSLGGSVGYTAQIGGWIFTAPDGLRLSFSDSHGFEPEVDELPSWSSDPADEPLTPTLMSATAGFGAVVTSSDPAVTSDLPDLVDAEPPSTASTIRADLYFPTGGSELDPEDLATLARVAGTILGYERVYPGSALDLSFNGLASARWRSARGEEERQAHNAELAVRRATHARDALVAMLEEVGATDDPMVAASLGRTHVDSAISGEEPESDLAEERRVHVEVTLEPCDPLRASP